MSKTTINGATSGFLTSHGDSFIASVDDVLTDITILNVSKVTFVAKARRRGRWWILKGLSEEAQSQELYCQMLIKEFEIVSQLQHPGVVSVFTLEDIKPWGLCILMEYLEGETLTGWLNEPHSSQEKRHVAHQLIETLGYVHSKGIQHRDLKPDNIIVTHNGTNLKLIDFGLADTDNYSILKQPAGTPGYISPEQTEAYGADVRNDIYSLGLILGELGFRPRSVVRKCLNPIQKRFRNIGELKDCIERKKHRERLLWIVSIVTVLTSLTIALIFLLLKKNLPEPELNPGQMIRAASLQSENNQSLDSILILRTASLQTENDSLRNELSLQRDLQSATNYSLDSVTTILNKKVQNDEMNSQRMNNALTTIKTKFYNWDFVQHIDTLTDSKYLNKNLYNDTNWVVFIREYIENNFKDLSESERLSTEYSLNLFFTKLITPYVQKYIKFTDEQTRSRIADRANNENDRS